MNSLMPLKVISLLPRNWNCDSMFRYSPPNLNVCAPRVHVSALLSEIDRGL